MLKRVLAAVAFAAACGLGAAQAHFVLLVPEAGGNTAKMVMSDDFEPDANVPVKKLEGSKIWTRNASKSEPAKLELAKSNDHFVVQSAVEGAGVWWGDAQWGVFQRGEGPSRLLIYHPKALVGEAALAAPPVGADAVLEIVPVKADKGWRFKILAKGKPVEGSEVAVHGEGHESKKANTSAEGLTEAFQASGRVRVTAKITEKTPGEIDGKKYVETVRYATLVAELPAAK